MERIALQEFKKTDIAIGPVFFGILRLCRNNKFKQKFYPVHHTSYFSVSFPPHTLTEHQCHDTEHQCHDTLLQVGTFQLLMSTVKVAAVWKCVEAAENVSTEGRDKKFLKH